ncbi:Hydrogen cyanide synthase subunit HcnB [compost metagenome]
MRDHWQRFAEAVQQAFKLDARVKSLATVDTLVCRCEDVSYGAVAANSGWREAKLTTRCGMGACQGRVCGGALEHLFDWTVGAPRPPFNPARIETLIEMATVKETP